MIWLWPVHSQLVYSGTTPRMSFWHLSSPRCRAAYPKHIFCCWSLCANDSQLSWRSAWHFNRVYPHHLPLEHLVEHELVGVYLCGRCKVVAPLPQIAKLSKNSQHSMWFQVWWANLSRYMESIKKIMSFGVIWVEVQSKNRTQSLVLRCCPSRPLLIFLLLSLTQKNFNISNLKCE